MKALTKIKTVGLASAAALLLAPTISMAEVSQNVAVNGSGHSVVHRVSYALAESKAYTRSGASGYKWGKSADPVTHKSADWETTQSTSGGFKWDEQSNTKSIAPHSLADSEAYKWGETNFSDQAAYRWGVRSYSDQSAYRWGVRSVADQAAYRWGVRSIADQAAYRWGVRSFADQTAYRWGVRSLADQTAYRWGVRSFADQAAYRWGVR